MRVCRTALLGLFRPELLALQCMQASEKSALLGKIQPRVRLFTTWYSIMKLLEILFSLVLKKRKLILNGSLISLRERKEILTLIRSNRFRYMFHLTRKPLKSAHTSRISTPSSPFISVWVPSSAFARMDQEPISRPLFKDSFGYYATRAPSRRCSCRHRRQLQASSAQPRAPSFAVLLPLVRLSAR